MEEHRIDVRDVDTEWFTDVVTYLDRPNDLWHFPEESIERLGEPDEDGSGNFWLLDGLVEAEANEIGVGGRLVRVWSVPAGKLVTRPVGAAGEGAQASTIS